MQIAKKLRAVGVLATAAIVISTTAACDLLKDEPDQPSIVGSYLSAVQVVGAESVICW